MARAIGSYPVGHLFESDRRYHLKSLVWIADETFFMDFLARKFAKHAGNAIHPVKGQGLAGQRSGKAAAFGAKGGLCKTRGSAQQLVCGRNGS